MTVSNTETKLPLVHVRGSHSEMGRQFGEQLSAQIKEYSETWLRNVTKRSGLTMEQALVKAKSFAPFVEEYAPHLAEEIRGVAEGAGISEAEAYSIQIRMELLYGGPPPLSCTTFAISGERTVDGRPIVGQNVDLAADVEKYGLILHLEPDEGPAIMIYTSPGLISYVGINSAGLAVHGNLLIAPGWRAGFPRYLVSRLMLEQSTVEEALAAGVKPPRASSRNLILGDSRGTIRNIELAIDDHRILEPENGFLVHTNHYIAPGLEGIEGKPPSASSCNRLERIKTLIGEEKEPLTVEKLQGFFRDHEGYPGSICAHPSGESNSKTVVSLISKPADGEMYVAPGNPCGSEYTLYRI
ncbi:MAG: hypothetical protein HY731_14445 [Candidatus Tectomicrobia bacterium]|nr:hypothetical protein [Candidatus Tectomicrobia bacterium]